MGEEDTERTFLASVLGDSFGNAESFAAECQNCKDQSLVVDLFFLCGPLVTLQGTNYLSFVRHHVLGCKVRTAFYIRAPLQSYLMQIAGSPKLLTTFKDNHFAFLVLLLQVTKDLVVETVACVVIPAVTKVVHDVYYVGDMCALVAHIAAVQTTRMTVLEPDLFRGLAMHFRLHPSEPSVVDVVQKGMLHLHKDLNVLFPVVRECAVFLETQGLCVRGLSALHLLEVCAANPLWRPHLIQHVVVYARRFGWEVVFGQLLSSLLQGQSVELVVKLHASGHLDSLIATSHAHSKQRVEWRAVRGLLRTHWPAQVDKFLPNHRDPPANPSSENRQGCPECPITLHPCVHPVMASDGRIYERDALMTHFTVHGMISPMTKQSLDYSIFAYFS